MGSGEQQLSLGYRNPEMLERQPSGNAEPAAGRTRRRGPEVTAKPGGVGRGRLCGAAQSPGLSSRAQEGTRQGDPEGTAWGREGNPARVSRWKSSPSPGKSALRIQ